MVPKVFRIPRRRWLVPALLVSVAVPAAAQFIETAGPQEMLATEFIGMPVYTVDEAGGAAGSAAAPDVAARGGWDSIGEVDDLLLDATGKVRAVLVDVGGFLGIGERTVAIDMSTLTLLTDEAGARFVTVAATRPLLESAPAYVGAPGAGTGSASPRSDSLAADRPGTDLGEAAPQTGVPPTTLPDSQTGAAPDATAPSPMADGSARDPAFVPVPAEALTADQLQDVTVYDSTGTSIGEIAEVYAKDGRVSEVLIDIGGFLGVGERRVMFPFDRIEVLQRSGDDDLRVEVKASREELERMPEREG